MSQPAEPFAILEWDSNFWGCRVARVAQPQRTSADLWRVLRAAQEARVDCLYYLLEAEDALAAQALVGTPFNMVDVRLTLACSQLGEARSSFDGVRLAVADDVPILRTIAANSHTDSRFYFDARFPRHKCDELYAEWIDKSVAGSLADAVLVCEPRSGVSGYVTCSVKADGVGEIGLIAVSEQARGHGQGSTLVSSALGWLASRRCQRARVVTQGRNLGAQRLYQRRGFFPSQSQVWYHAWLDMLA